MPPKHASSSPTYTSWLQFGTFTHTSCLPLSLDEIVPCLVQVVVANWFKPKHVLVLRVRDKGKYFTGVWDICERKVCPYFIGDAGRDVFFFPLDVTKKGTP